MKVAALCLVFVSFSALGQSVKVVPESVKLSSGSAEGFSVLLEGDVDQVESQLMKFLKPVGKIKRGNEENSISLPTISGKTYTSPLLFMVRDKGNASAWIGIRKVDVPDSTNTLMTDIERLVYDFGVTFYRNKIQEQIDQSSQALAAVEKQQQRLLSQNKDLNTKLEGNKNQKIALEKAIENNKLEFEALNKKIDRNKKDQDSVAVAAEQIMKVIELHKERQRKVN